MLVKVTINRGNRTIGPAVASEPSSTMEPRQKVLLVLLSVSIGTTPVLCDNPIRLDAGAAHPFHYEVELRVDVQSKSFTAEATIELHLGEDTQELMINSNNMDGDWHNSRLVNLDTGEEYVTSLGLTVWDDFSEVLQLHFPETIPGGSNYTLHLKGMKGDFQKAFQEMRLDSNR